MAVRLAAQSPVEVSPSQTAQDGALSAGSPAPQSQIPPETTQPDSPITVLPEAQKDYVPALDGTGLILLNSLKRVNVFAGSTFSGGWDSNPGSLGNNPQAFFQTISPYIAMHVSSRQTQFLIQYMPTFTKDIGYSAETMHLASAKLIGNLGERWKWTMSVDGSHGQDSIRLLTPTGSSSVGDVPANGSNSAAYLPNAGTITDINAGLGFMFDISPRSNFRFQFTNSYNSIPALHESGSVVTGGANYLHHLSPKLSILGYEQTSGYYGGLSCLSVGGGAGLAWQPRERVSIAMGAGPLFSTSSCKNPPQFSYNVSISAGLPRRLQAYLRASRQPTTGYLGPGLSQDEVAAGIRRQMGESHLLAFNVGYVHSSSLTSTPSYEGAYYDSSYTHNFSRRLAMICSYRSYAGSASATSFHRNVALISLTWTANSRSISQ
jgi:hypothetical protein